MFTHIKPQHHHNSTATVSAHIQGPMLQQLSQHPDALNMRNAFQSTRPQSFKINAALKPALLQPPDVSQQPAVTPLLLQCPGPGPEAHPADQLSLLPLLLPAQDCPHDVCRGSKQERFWRERISRQNHCQAGSLPEAA
jgi:hypothetical protein